MTTLIAVGKLKESYYKDAVLEYTKRMQSYRGIQIIEIPEHRLPDNPKYNEIQNALSREADLIRAKLRKNTFIFVFTPEGKQLSSEQFAEKIQLLRTSGYSDFTFIIGSSYGIHTSLKQEASFLFSVSPMTFPHHLFRIMALEQIYRAESLLAGSKYHK